LTSDNIHYRLKEFFDLDTKAEVEAIEKYRQIITTCRLRGTPALAPSFLTMKMAV